MRIVVCTSFECAYIKASLHYLCEQGLAGHRQAGPQHVSATRGSGVALSPGGIMDAAAMRIQGPINTCLACHVLPLSLSAEYPTPSGHSRYLPRWTGGWFSGRSDQPPRPFCSPETVMIHRMSSSNREVRIGLGSRGEGEGDTSTIQRAHTHAALWMRGIFAG